MKMDSQKVEYPHLWTNIKMQSCKRYRNLVKLYPKARKKGYSNEHTVYQ